MTEEIVIESFAAEPDTPAVQSQQQLSRIIEVPLESVVRRPEPLNDKALGLLRAQDAQRCDQDLRVIRFDDELAALAARRGLLVRFLVSSLRTYVPFPELSVEAPEFMTVEYLKRRVFRAKLQRGEYLAPSRFILRKRTTDPGQTVVLQDVPSQTPSSDEVFLFNEGFIAPGTYELFIQAASSSNDSEQQERLLGISPVGQPGSMANPLAGMGIDPRSLFQHLMLGSDSHLPGFVTPGALHQLVETRDGQGPGLAVPMPMAAGMPGLGQDTEALEQRRGEEAVPSTKHGASSSCVQNRHRRQTGRWGMEEVEALIEGVREVGTSWSQIHTLFTGPGRINKRRSQMDLKDKWRNLVRSATNPGRHSRGLELTEQQRQDILRAVFERTAHVEEVLAASGPEASHEHVLRRLGDGAELDMGVEVLSQDSDATES